MGLKISIFTFFFFVLSLTSYVLPTVFAADDFDISTNSSYDVSESGLTQVSQTVKITNKTEYTYTPSYTIITGINDIKNLKVYNDSGNLPHKTDGTSKSKSIEITFPDRVVGMGKINEFTISFDTNLIAHKKGSIWEVSVPGLTDPNSFQNYNVLLKVPESFGAPSISKPKKSLSSRGPYQFTKNDVGKSGILILFGKSQFYKLSLKYHLKNDGVVPVKTEIALPPDTSYQDIRIKKMSPQPLNVYQDVDGNWLAIYSLSSGQKQTVNVDVIAHVYSEPVFSINDPPGNLASSKYWEVGSPEIKKIAQELKTPEKIYDYVVSTLTYNYKKIESENLRLGALSSLKQPDYAVCLEFTDLFIALARAAGIKARSVEGYAYTDDAKLRPLSLVQDILHSWPEYYDENKKAWIMVDPTWGNTTSGMDYFNSFDFDHITLVIKGRDSTYPVPAGGYKLDKNTKDIEVSFAQSTDFENIFKTNITADIPRYVLPFQQISGNISLYNYGNMAIRAKKLYVKSDLEPNIQEYYIDVIPPYGKKNVGIAFNKTPILTNKSHNITMQFDGNSLTKTTTIGFFPDYYLILLGGAIIFGSGTISIITYKTWSIYIQRRKRESDLRRKSAGS